METKNLPDKPQKTGAASKLLGVSQTMLRRWADRDLLPAGAVATNPSGHRTFNVRAIHAWRIQNHKRQTQFTRTRK